MVLRTTSRQAEVLSILTEDPEHDPYKISAHGTTCRICAPLEGRVYSKSGRDPDFPPLSAAFGKVDPNGPDDLSNTWLNLHPNYLHQIIRWTAMRRSEDEIRKIKDFSSFKKNPPTKDPRTEKQIKAYRQKEANRAKWLRDYRQWERYRETLGDGVPRTFQTFQTHKAAGDEKYRAWESGYRKALAKSKESDILKSIKYDNIPITEEAVQRVPLVRPDGWSQGQALRLQEAHRELLRTVQGRPPGTEAGAVYTPDMKLIARRVGKDAAQAVNLPRCAEPHIVIHNHPEGLTFSPEDINSFGTRFDTVIMTAVGNEGSVYLLQKTERYDPVGFAIAFGNKLMPQLQKAANAQEYVDVINSFLRKVDQYGVRFITGTKDIF